MAPSKVSKLSPEVQRIKRREKIKRETPEQRAARLENARRYSQTRFANETWEQREARLARIRYYNVQKKIKNLRKKHEMELLRKMRALNLTTEDQRQAFREKEKLNAKMAECQKRMMKIKEELQKNRLRIIEADKEAKRQRLEMEIKQKNKGNQAKEHEGEKVIQKDRGPHINLFQAFNLIDECEISRYVNNLLQNCPPSPSSYSHILKIYGYDSINSVLKNTTSYCSENQIGRSPLGVSELNSAGLIQQCYSSDPTNIPSSSKLEIKCEVGESDENILKAYLKLGIVKNEPLEPSVVAEGGSLHGYSQSATSCELSYEHVNGNELWNNSVSDNTDPDPGEEMVIASLPSYEHVNSDELVNNSVSDNTYPDPGEEMVIASLSYEHVNGDELLTNCESVNTDPDPGEEMVIALDPANILLD